MIRNMSVHDLREKYHAVLSSITNSLASDKKAEDTTLVDLYVMCIQARDCRGGKGEREVFFQLFLLLAESFPKTTRALIPLISQYGSYKDYFSILDIINNSEDSSWATTPALLDMKMSILEHIANRLKIDESLMEKVKSMSKESHEDVYKVKQEVSLCAKYCPREGKAFWNKDKHQNVECINTLLSLMYPESTGNVRKNRYRKLCAGICTFLDITEQKMCGKRFSDIVFKKVPSISTKKYAKAFLNEKVKDNSIRYPDDQDRNLCREHFIEHITSGKVKGGQLFPHEIVTKIMSKAYKMNIIEKELIKGQWDSMKETLTKQIEESMKAASDDDMEVEKGGAVIDLGKLVPLSDVSGSMHGTPMMPM